MAFPVCFPPLLQLEEECAGPVLRTIIHPTYARILWRTLCGRTTVRRTTLGDGCDLTLIKAAGSLPHRPHLPHTKLVRRLTLNQCNKHSVGVTALFRKGQRLKVRHLSEETKGIFAYEDAEGLPMSLRVLEHLTRKYVEPLDTLSAEALKLRQRFGGLEDRFS